MGRRIKGTEHTLELARERLEATDGRINANASYIATLKGEGA